MSGQRTANRAGSAAALVGPRRPSLVAARGIPFDPLARLSLDEYARARSAPDRVVLCPAGRSLDADIAFLRAAGRRLLWPQPPADLRDAIAGLLPESAAEPAAAPARRRSARTGARSPLHTALLLEGIVTRERADLALSSPPRLWIVESVRCVGLDAAELEDLERKGVRWAALSPVELAGVAASPALARARSRWPRGLRRGRLWVRRAARGR